MKEQYKLQNGKYVVPSPIENLLQLSPYIVQACVYGDNRDHNIALLVPDTAKLGAALGCDPATVLQARAHDVHALLLAEAKRLCAEGGVRSYERVSTGGAVLLRWAC